MPFFKRADVAGLCYFSVSSFSLPFIHLLTLDRRERRMGSGGEIEVPKTNLFFSSLFDH